VPTILAALAPTLNRVGPSGYILLIKSVAIFPAFCAGFFPVRTALPRFFVFFNASSVAPCI